MTNLQLAINAAHAAGEIIQEGFEQVHSVSEKENKSLVTEIDTAAEDAILKILGDSHPVLAEETANTLKNESIYWAVDPLDGTTNFIRHIPFFAVSIALIKDNSPILGVIFNPITNELYTSEMGKGARLNNNKIKVSEEKSVVCVNTGYAAENNKKYAEVNAKVANENYTIRKMGSTACELAMIARGAADGFICWGDALWDHAAGILLVREAGGNVTDWKGTHWNTDTDYVLAANKTLHPQLLKITTELFFTPRA